MAANAQSTANIKMIFIFNINLVDHFLLIPLILSNTLQVLRSNFNWIEFFSNYV